MVSESVPLSDMECNLDEYFTEDDHNLELEEYNNNREEIEIEKVPGGRCLAGDINPSDMLYNSG